MSNPNKRWSWGGAFGRSTGTALTGIASGVISGTLGGPLGIPVGAAVFGSIGFVTGLIGNALGYWWDDIKRKRESFGSGALFTLVISGILDLNFVMLLSSNFSAGNSINAMILLICFSSIISSASKSLIDDLHTTYSARIDIDQYDIPSLKVDQADDKDITNSFTA